MRLDNYLDRDEGYLDLDAYLNIGFDDIPNTDKVEYIKAPNTIEFSIANQRYIYKSTALDIRDYVELFYQRVAEYFRIKVAKYDLAKFDATYGVITKDFKCDNKLYISMKEILQNYAENFAKKDESEKTDNNLENIWNCLDFMFQANPKREEVVKNLMDEIITMYILDILIGNRDRHLNNYMLELDFNENDVHLAPLYDHSLAIDNLNLVAIDVIYNNEDDIDKFKVLEKFLIISSSEFIDKFNDMYDKFNKDLFDLILKNIENDTKQCIPEDIKQEFYNYLHDTRYRIDEILNNKQRRLLWSRNI